EFVRPKPKSPARLAGFFFFRNDVSGRVSGVERRRRLLRAVLRHFGGVGGSFLAARPETRPRDVVLGGATLLAALADPGFLTDRLRHVVFASGFALLGTSRRHIPDRRRSCTPGLSGPAAILHERQCRVPPSPPAIRGMKKPRQRMRRRGFEFVLGKVGGVAPAHALPSQVAVAAAAPRRWFLARRRTMHAIFSTVGISHQRTLSGSETRPSHPAKIGRRRFPTIPRIG